MPRRILVITVHGIRTFGQWQERLETSTKAAASPGDDVVFRHKHYGYFSVFMFLNPFSRRAEVKRFSEELKSILADANVASFDRICLVGHSFGTHVIAHALLLLPPEIEKKVDTVILAGSVLPDDFAWDRLLGRQIVRVVNDCGNKDWIVPLNAIMPLASGVAGRIGFRGIMTDEFSNRFFEIGHSGYFFKSARRIDAPDDNWFMAKYWAPLLLDHGPINYIDERTKTFWSGIVTGLVARTERFKWVIPAILILSVAGIADYQITLKKKAETAELNRQEDLALTLAGNAQDATSSGDATVGTLLAIEAATTWPSASQRPADIKISKSLYSALIENREIMTIVPGKGELTAISPALSLIAIANPTGAIRIVGGLSGATVATLASSGKPVTTMSFSSDGRALVVVSGGVATVWDIATQKPIQAGGTPQASVLKATFCGPSPRIATTPGGFGGDKITVWNAETATALVSSGNAVGANIRCNADGSRLVAYDTSGVWLIDTQKNMQLADFSPDFAEYPPVFSRDGNKLLLSDKADLLLVNADNGTLIRDLHPPAEVECSQFSHDGQYVVAGSGLGSGTIFVWNTASGDMMKPWKLGDDAILSIAMDRKNQQILVGMADSTVRVVDFQSGRQLFLQRHPAPVVRAIFGPFPESQSTTDDAVESMIVSASKDGTVDVWCVDPIASPQLSLHFRTSVAAVSDIQLQYSADRDLVGKSLNYPIVVGVLANQGVATWNARESLPMNNVSMLAVSRDGKFAAYRDKGPTFNRIIRVIDLERRSALPPIYAKGHTDSFTLKADLTPDGKRLVSIGADGSLKLWDTATGALLQSAGGFAAKLTAVATSPDGSHFALGFSDGTLAIWNLSPLEAKSSSREHQQTVNTVAYSPGGTRIVTTSTDRSLRVWDAATGTAIKTASLTNDVYWDAVYNKGGTAIATAQGSGNLTLLDANTLVERSSVKIGNYNYTYRMAYDPGGTRFVVSGNLLDGATMDELVAAAPQNSWTLSPYFAADGAENIATDVTGHVSIHPLPPELADLVKDAQSTVPRCLTLAERSSFDALKNTPPPAWCIDLNKWPYGASKPAVAPQSAKSP